MADVLLLNFDSGTPTDASASAHTIAVVSPATISTAQKKAGASSLLCTAGSAARATVTGTLTDFNFGSGQFTLEAWVYWTSAPNTVSTYGGPVSWTTGSGIGWDLWYSAGQLQFTWSTTGSAYAGTVGGNWTPLPNKWYHVAADRDASNVLRVYINGQVLASSTVAATFFNNSTQPVSIGNSGPFNRGFPGYIDEVRVNNGTALYAGAFTPTGPVPGVNIVTQVALEVLQQGNPPRGRVTQVAMEVLATVADAIPPKPKPVLVLSQ